MGAIGSRRICVIRIVPFASEWRTFTDGSQVGAIGSRCETRRICLLPALEVVLFIAERCTLSDGSRAGAIKS